MSLVGSEATEYSDPLISMELQNGDRNNDFLGGDFLNNLRTTGVEAKKKPLL
jgi:hypothetical protein